MGFSTGGVQDVPPGTADWYIQNMLSEADQLINGNSQLSQFELESIVGDLQVDLVNLSSYLPGKTSGLLTDLEALQKCAEDCEQKGIGPNVEMLLEASSYIVNDAAALTNNSTIQLEQIRVGVGDLTAAACHLYQNDPKDFSAQDCGMLLGEADATAVLFFDRSVSGESAEVELALDQFMEDEGKTGVPTLAQVQQLSAELNIVRQELPEPIQG